MCSLKVRSTTPYANGKSLNAALPSTGEPGTPLNVPGARGTCAPWLGARSPTTGFETSWQVPQSAEERWKWDCTAWCRAVASEYGPSLALPAEITYIPPPEYAVGGLPPSFARKGGLWRPACSEPSGFTMRRQRSQPTPSCASLGVSAEPSVGVDRPSSQPVATWQRMHRSPAPSKSCSATATVAQNSGSRAAWDIMLPRQTRAGSTAGA
jgi:hypothetical protein